VTGGELQGWSETTIVGKQFKGVCEVGSEDDPKKVEAAP
jgi:hypothetical protein